MIAEAFDGRSVLDAVVGGVIVVGADGAIAGWNEWMTAVSRKPEREVIGRTLVQVFPDRHLDVLKRAIASAIESGASTLLTNTLHPRMLPLRTLAGRTLLHDIMVSPVGGALGRGCLVQITDVTNAVRREQFLRQRQNARYDALLDGVPDAIVNIDGAGAIQHANPAVERLLGYAPGQLVGADAGLLFDSEDTWKELRGLLAATRSVEPTEVLVRHRDGSLRYFEVSATSWLDGFRELTTAILRDVNDRHQTELALRESERASRESARALAELNEVLKESSAALRTADQRKDAFLATLAHELRNPLAPLRNGLQLLKLAKDDPAFVERTRSMMEQQLGQMVRLIDDLLDVSRINNDLIELAMERMPIDLPIRQAVEMSRPLLDSQQQELTIELAPEPIFLNGDATRLTQVFVNLLNNAAKYTPKGGEVRIEAGHEDGMVAVRIIDNGIGIPQPLLDRIFDMFVRVDDSLERAHGGLGVGLSLVKRLVEMHGGAVEAHSAGRGKGSEFVVRLPMAAAPAPEAAASHGDEAAREPTGMRVLVVDDNSDAANSLAAILRISGYETKTAGDGLEALDIAEEFHPHVTLLDIGMPRLNGYEAARRMRERAWGKDMLIVALTGWGQASDRRRSSDAGFDEHFVKPVDVAQVRALLASHAAPDNARSR